MQISDWLQKILWLICPKKAEEPSKENIVSIGHDSIERRVHFRSIRVVDRTPKNESVGESEFVLVIHQNESYWALFQCPCGCCTMISLSLQKIHTPSWTVKETVAGRPSLYPSVWQNKGCFSHFWIQDGQICWCGNSGLEPWVAEPKYYSRPKTVRQTCVPGPEIDSTEITTRDPASSCHGLQSHCFSVKSLQISGDWV